MRIIDSQKKKQKNVIGWSFDPHLPCSNQTV